MEMKKHLFNTILFLILLPFSTLAGPFVLVLSQDDFKDAIPDPTSSEPEPDFDDFPYSETNPDYSLDPGSWTHLFEPDPAYLTRPEKGQDGGYYEVVVKMLEAASGGDVRVMEEAASELEVLAAEGHPHGQSVLGFMYDFGIVREKRKEKGFVYHHFAAEGGNLQSKMALAYTYYRQDR